MKSSIHSTFPKGQDKQGFRKTLDLFGRVFDNKGEYADFEKVREDIRTEIISVMWKAGLWVINDGMLDWLDMVNPMVKGEGVIRGGIQCDFDCLYYRPKLTGTTFSKFDLFEDEVDRITRNVIPRDRGKFCVTGPYSLMKMSDLEVDGVTEDDWADHFSKLVMAQVNELSNYFGYVQINEPALAFTNDADLFNTCLYGLQKYNNESTRKHDVILSAPGGDLSEDVIWSLVHSPLELVIHLDLVEGWGSVERLAQESLSRIRPIRLQLGVLDGRSPKMEFEQESSSMVMDVLSRVQGSQCELITTSCGLEYLSWEKAAEKLALTESVVQVCNQRLRKVSK